MKFDIIEIEKDLEVTEKFYESHEKEYTIEYKYKGKRNEQTYDQVHLCQTLKQYGLIESFSWDGYPNIVVTYLQLDAPDSTMPLEEFIARVFSDFDAKLFLIAYYRELQMAEWAKETLGEYRKKAKEQMEKERKEFMSRCAPYNKHVEPNTAAILCAFANPLNGVK